MEKICPSCGAAVPQGARFCPSCGLSVVATPSTTGEERKVVTILFADVTGSTALGEQLDPERLRSVMQAWFNAASEAVTAWGGKVEKFIGDAVVAVFGVPQVREDDPARALHAALFMLGRLPELNQKSLVHHRVELAVRIGVNTGEVIAPRDPPPGAALVTGDAVNVAARLQDAAEPNSVLVGERTALAAREGFVFDEPRDYRLKGKAETVRARRLIGAEAADSAGSGRRGLGAPMIGRQRELATIADALAEVRERNRPYLVTVYGPAGMGKSRLVQEFLDTLPAEVTVLRGRCLAAGGATYWALSEILRRVCDVSLDEPAEEAALKISRTVSEALGGADDRGRGVDVAVTRNALAISAGITLADNPLVSANPSEVAEEVALAWPRFLTALAARGPLLIVIEDLHWASEELVVMIKKILSRSTGTLLLLATARPEFEQQHAGLAAGREDAIRIGLRPLTSEQGEDLLSRLVRTDELPKGLLGEIVERVEGNPFFLEEILRRLIDEGALVHSGDRWRPTDRAARVDLPDSVQTLLASRIDLLSQSEKRVLQEASVVGRVFWQSPVRQLVGSPVGSDLAALEERGFVSVRPNSSIDGEVEYSFRHALVRDVAYASLPRRRRAIAHAEVADWIEGLAGERTAEYADLIAHHYAEALLGDDADLGWEADPARRERVRSRAFAALITAGDAARQRYELDRAVRHHEQALLVAGDELDRGRAREALGRDEDVAFHGDESLAHYSAALDVARRHGDRPAVARLILRMTKLICRVGAFRSPIDPTVAEALQPEALASADDEGLRAELLIEFGASLPSAYQYVDRPDPQSVEARIRLLDEAREIAERLDDPDLRFEVVDAFNTLQWLNGDREGAESTLRRSIELLPAVEDRSIRALGYYFSSHLVRGWLADYETALELGRRALEEGRPLSAHELMHGTFVVMICLYRLGRWDELPDLIDTHLGVYQSEAGRACLNVRAGVAIAALLAAHQGRTADAHRLVELAGDPPRPTVTVGDCLLAEALTVVGDTEAAVKLVFRQADKRGNIAEQFVEQAQLHVLVARHDWGSFPDTLARARSLVPWEALLGPQADRAEGRMLTLTRRRDEGANRLRQAAEAFEGYKLPFELARTREWLADAVDDADERRRLLDAALEAYERLGASLHADRVRAILATPPSG